MSGLADRFWAKVEQRESSSCWAWRGYSTPSGRPHMSVNSSPTTAARVAFFVAHGRWPKVACHSCDNPGCVNPAHIWDGSHSDNIKDAVKKRRHFNAARTHCQHGHEFTVENTKTYGNRRVCRTCDRRRQSEARLRLVTFGKAA